MKQNKEQNNMKVVGITGGVGSGKSVVMNILKEKYGNIEEKYPGLIAKVEKKLGVER